jgi:hypothetical protein
MAPTLLARGRLSRLCVCRNDANQIYTCTITVFGCQVLAKAIGDQEPLGLLKPDMESIELLSGPAVQPEVQSRYGLHNAAADRAEYRCVGVIARKHKCDSRDEEGESNGRRDNRAPKTQPSLVQDALAG